MRGGYCYDSVWLCFCFGILFVFSPPPFFCFSCRACVWQGVWLASPWQQMRHTWFHSALQPVHKNLVFTPPRRQIIPSRSVELCVLLRDFLVCSSCCFWFDLPVFFCLQIRQCASLPYQPLHLQFRSFFPCALPWCSRCGSVFLASDQPAASQLPASTARAFFPTQFC